MSDTKGSSEKLLYCSFCGKSQHEVRKLIAGPSVFICDECIELCNDIIREETQGDQATKGVKSDLPVPREIREHVSYIFNMVDFPETKPPRVIYGATEDMAKGKEEEKKAIAEMRAYAESGSENTYGVARRECEKCGSASGVFRTHGFSGNRVVPVHICAKCADHFVP